MRRRKTGAPQEFQENAVEGHRFQPCRESNSCRSRPGRRHRKGTPYENAQSGVAHITHPAGTFKAKAPPLRDGASWIIETSGYSLNYLLGEREFAVTCPSDRTIGSSATLTCAFAFRPFELSGAKN
jgi:hypothetical protein